MAMKVAIPQDITDAGKNFLREKGYELIIGDGDVSQEHLAELLKDADALLARTAKYALETIASAKNLKVIGRHGVGYDNLPVAYCLEHGIAVYITPRAKSEAVAEHTIALMLASVKKISYSDREVRKGEWSFRNHLGGYNLAGKTIGIIGLGRIGRLVAEKAVKGLGMQAIGYDAFLPESAFPEGVKAAKSMEEIYEQADIVTLHVPSTPESIGMINAKTLGLMKKNAHLINAARGDLVNEADLYEALKSGVIAGAAVDVISKEPPEVTNPLLSLDNFIITPHSAALTQESMDNMGLHAAMAIHDGLSGADTSAPGKPYGHVNG